MRRDIPSFTGIMSDIDTLVTKDELHQIDQYVHDAHQLQYNVEAWGGFYALSHKAIAMVILDKLREGIPASEIVSIPAEELLDAAVRANPIEEVEMGTVEIKWIVSISLSSGHWLTIYVYRSGTSWQWVLNRPLSISKWTD